MLPFSADLKPGLPIADQVVLAVKKAVLTGQLQAGERFPSVRQLSQSLRINPNTAHRIIAALVNEGVLLATPAVGTTVATPANGTRAEKAEVLGPELERLMIEARRLGLKLADVQDALVRHWIRLGGDSPSP